MTIDKANLHMVNFCAIKLASIARIEIESVATGLTLPTVYEGEREVFTELKKSLKRYPLQSPQDITQERSAHQEEFTSELALARVPGEYTGEYRYLHIGKATAHETIADELKSILASRN